MGLRGVVRETANQATSWRAKGPKADGAIARPSAKRHCPSDTSASTVHVMPLCFHERVIDFAKELAAMPPEALGLAKVAIDAAASVDHRTAREIDRLAQTTRFMSGDYRDRVNAFDAASAARQPKPPEGRE
jgi:hypothetical protein